MAVKKSAKKATARKASPKKETGSKPKKAKAGERAAEGKPKKAKAGERPAEGKSAKSAAARKRPPASRASKAEPAKKKTKGGVSSMSVNLGHIFSLRPRVSKTFRQADFLTARHLLQDEDYADIEAAARAVAEKALELTHQGPPKRGFRPGR